jgi:uncharacterized protein Yka (UPF0111/DUF47 family)
MSLFFFPRSIKFEELFLEQNREVTAAARSLAEAFARPEDLSTRCREVIEGEKRVEQLTLRIANELARTFITKLDREDIHELNQAQEELANALRAVVTRAGLYNLSPLQPAAREIAADISCLAVMLSERLTKFFERKMPASERPTWQPIVESAENLLLVGIGELMETPLSSFKGLSAIVKWTQIYDRLEKCLAAAKRLAIFIDGAALKYF